MSYNMALQLIALCGWLLAGLIYWQSDAWGVIYFSSGTVFGVLVSASYSLAKERGEI